MYLSLIACAIVDQDTTQITNVQQSAFIGLNNRRRCDAMRRFCIRRTGPGRANADFASLGCVDGISLKHCTNIQRKIAQLPFAIPSFTRRIRRTTVRKLAYLLVFFLSPLSEYMVCVFVCVGSLSSSIMYGFLCVVRVHAACTEYAIVCTRQW